MKKLSVWLVALVTMAMSGVAQGATLQMLGPDPNNSAMAIPPATHACTHRLDGYIENGDAERVISQLKVDLPDDGSRLDYTNDQAVLCLNSPGGSLTDAARIANAIVNELRYGLGTKIESGDSCLSACAIIFMAGAYWIPEFIPVAWRVLEPGGTP